MIVIKVSKEDFSEFSTWLGWVVLEAARNGGAAVEWAHYSGRGGHYYELWGNEGVMSYAKLKWGQVFLGKSGTSAVVPFERQAHILNSMIQESVNH